ncbi:hypothetical protein NA56DRAFT_691658 [Hyaloscypha hepaticicola]|uniref:SANT domain-containing protein n=1 Tax=Hyaloscypha hepaticicola TaxID=2082293 RepID=A0A2J6PUI2_9HELO|nr:hypothetical protein NA56DRAFT_691658 [Hyaloscypha hepaticicola]
MSRYQPSYGDSGESRRSPRDQSPGRYNDRDEFRGGSGRGVERRRPSISDTRVNHNAFASNRETFREPIGRDSSREFPPREPPRGPKVLIDAPTGPRASSYGGSDYRGDFGGYRGDYRGDRSRGRGRGSWRDDSRDRGREPDRDYRDRRDDRGPPPPQFRDDRGRDRYTREVYRGRRQSPPQGRGRSPNYQPRDIRDPPPSIELERTRRGSRDGPLSCGILSSENQSFARGYGRGRGGRGGRGRGYYDEYHRPPGRSRSPDPSWGRRTQPSATPPPQVPAFGSASSNAPVASGTSPGHTTTSTNLGPIPGVAVPTAPRFERQAGPTRARLPASIQLVNVRRHHAEKDSSAQLSTFISPTKNISPQSVPMHSPEARFEPEEVKTESKAIRPASRSKTPESSNRRNVNEHPPQQTSRKRRPVTGKRPEKPRKSPVFDDIPDEPSDSDSADDFEDGYFEGEIAKLKEKVEQIQEDNPIKPREEPHAVFVQPFIQFKVDDLVAEPELTDSEPCIAPKVDEKPVPESSPMPPSLAPTSGRKRKSRSATPLEGNNAVSLANGTAKEDPSATESSAAVQSGEASIDFQIRGPLPSPKDAEPTSMQSKVAKPPTAGRPRKPLMSDEFGAMSDDERSQPATSIGPRKPMMSDEFAAVSDEDMSKPPTNGQPRKPMISDEFAAVSDDEMTKPAISGVPRKPMVSDEFAGASNHGLSEAENLEALEAVRKQMRTPPLSSLPTFSVKKWTEDPEFLQTLVADPKVEARVKKVIQDTKERRAKEQEEARKQWKARYLEYRRWTDFSDDPAAKASRDKFEKSRARAAAEAAAPRLSTMPSAGAKPEPQRRTGSRWATEHDFERVLRESEQEAKETKEREERVARARTASAKEAKIPDMAWDEEEWQATQYIDKTHLIPFERSFAALEFGEPIDNFTEDEAAVFEATYLEFPKQFTKIAEALNGRGFKRDYKACIQHYYLVKHSSSLKEKLKKQPKKKKGRKAGGPKPKSNALMADLGAGRDEGEDGQEGENGERRRPRRAAAPVWPFETPASESEVASPAPTPGRKSAAAPKGDANGDAAPTKRKTKAPREKATKQSKNNQLLAAAPVAPANRRADSPATPAAPEWKNQRPESAGTSHFPAQYDGAGSSGTFAPPYVPVERPNPSMTVNFDVMPQPFPTQERLESAPPPINYESQQDRRNIQQTSSYWSVPEQNDFPALLRHFGTDWHGIAKWMTSKTHIMVYTTVFQQWLVVPQDTNKSRRVANIQTQVKNYYQRQVDSGKMKEWEDIARDADEKKARGEETGPPPQLTVLPKRRHDMTPGSLQRSGSAMEGVEDLVSTGQTSMTHASPPQAVLSTRFPALAQAGPVAQIQPATAASVLNKHLPPQPIQQAPQTVQQQQPRAPRGPAMGYFTTDTPPRSIIQADAVSQRSLMVAQEAQIERNSALRLEREQREQQQQQQAAMQRERHFQMKQEPEGASVHQFEPYAAPSMHSSNIPHSRPDPPKPTPPAPAEVRRTAAPQQFQPRTHQPGRTFLGDNVGVSRDMKSSPSPAQPRPPMSAPPPSQEAYPPPPPPQPAPVAAIRQETVRKSNIMSLLNSDEPSDPRPTPPKRVSDVSVSSLHASQAAHTPPPSHPLQTSRFAGHSPLPPSQAPQQLPQQMGPQPGSQQQQQQQQLPPTQHPYAQPTSHSLHQHNSSMSHSRSYTPTGFDNRPYPAQPIQQQQAPQQMYSQTPRQSMGSQPPPIRRDQAHSEVHGITSGYVRTAAPPQSRLKDPPYSASPTPAQTPTIRQPAASPLELAPQSERDYYSRSQQYLIQQPQQQSAAGSPQLGPTTYHTQSQQPAPTNRHLAFGQSQPHIASPPTQYATHRPTHRSRGNSFDGRYQMATTSAPTPVQQSYVQAPQHPGAPLSIQYQQQQHSTQERYQERYPPPQDAEMRMQEDAYRRLDDQRRLDDPRRLDDQRRLEEQQRRMALEEHQQRRHEEQRRLDDARRY